MVDSHPFPPACVERFEPIRPLASGGFGEVWLAHQRGLDRPVALKLLHRAVRTDPALVQRFRNEARATASISHPNVVIVIDLQLDCDVPWIAYEYLSGPTLGEMLRRMPLAWPDAIGMAAQVTGALAAAHKCGILHRDIKPDNIVAAGENLYKLADFGIAKWIAEEERAARTAADIILGTPAYLAPELVKGAPASPRTDLYALGITLYEAIAGTPPFRESSVREVLDRQVHERPPDLRARVPQLPPPVVRLVDRLLAKDPQGRPESALQLLGELEMIMGARIPRPTPLMASRTERITITPVEPGTARPPEPGGPRRPAAANEAPPVVQRVPERHRSTRWAIGAALVIALVVGLAFRLQAFLALREKLNEADRLRKAGQIETAASILHELMASGQDNADVEFQCGLIWSARGKTNDAIRHVLRAVTMDPDHLDARSTYVILLTQSKQLARLQQAHAGKYRTYHVEGVLLLAERQATAAVATLERCLPASTKGDSIRFDYARALLAAGRTQEGERELADVLRSYGAQFPMPRDMGALLLLQGNPAQAIVFLRKALQQEPESKTIIRWLADCHIRLKRLSEARDYMAKLSKLEPDDHGLLVWLAVDERDRGRFQVARRYLEKALKIAPHLPELRLQLGILLHEMGDSKRAEPEFSFVVRYSREGSSDAVMAYLFLAKIHRARGEVVEALSACRSGLALRRDDGMHLLEYAGALAEAGNGPQAVAVASRALDLYPQGGAVSVSADIAKRLEEYKLVEDARALWLRLLRSPSAGISMRQRYALFLERQGETRSSESEFKSILRDLDRSSMTGGMRRLLDKVPKK
jgi:tetratricopeptide (TPR) repeat protein